MSWGCRNDKPFMFSPACCARCIKPNQVKKPRIFETESTLGQLISLSVLEAVAIIHKGFAYRASFADFVNDNSVLLRVLGAKVVSLLGLACALFRRVVYTLVHNIVIKEIQRGHSCSIAISTSPSTNKLSVELVSFT